MQRDPAKVVDATKDTSTNWTEKVKSGELVRTSGHAKHNASDPSVLHIQGRPINDDQARARIVPASVMEYVANTGRYPSREPGSKKYVGGCDFNPDGTIKREEPPS